MRTKHTYTGNSDGDSGGVREGLMEFMRHVIYFSEGRLWNNGTYVKRDMRGKPGSMSVHATGRAVDLSWRKMPTKGFRNSRAHAEHIANFLARHADTLGVELVLDYWPKPYGRGYKWTGGSWKNYDKPTIHGAPDGDWLHIELSPRWADSKALVRESFEKIFPQG